MVYPEKDLQNVLAHRIMHADHLKRRVLNSGWQCIRIDLAIVEKPGQKELSGGIDGNFAPGWTGPGGVPPQLKDYEDELLPGRERELRQFTAILSDKMEQSLR